MNEENTPVDMVLSNQRIGFVELGDLGRDEYLLLTRLDGVLQPAEARRRMKLKFHRSLKELGGYYCVNVSATQYPGNSSACIVIVSHRYDI